MNEITREDKNEILGKNKKIKRGKISFSSDLNYHKSLFLIPKVSKVLFFSSNFSKRIDSHPFFYFC